MTADIEFNNVNPTFWNVQISTTRPSTVGLRRSFMLKNGKKKWTYRVKNWCG